MPETHQEILRERRRLKAEYSRLFDEVEALLFRHDPLSLNYQTNTDEYAPEVGTILPRLRTCGSADEVIRVVHEEFARWFGVDGAGSCEQYSEIGMEIWRLWQGFRSAEPDAPPIGGAATRFGNSEAGQGPPSLS